MRKGPQRTQTNLREEDNLINRLCVLYSEVPHNASSIAPVWNRTNLWFIFVQ